MMDFATESSDLAHGDRNVYEDCDRCNRRSTVSFRVADSTWAAVIGTSYHRVCTTCFDELADDKNVRYRFLEIHVTSWNQGFDDEWPHLDLPCAECAGRRSRENFWRKRIASQRARGWPDFHPEDYCHRCGRPNPIWSSPEWPELVGGHGGNDRHPGVLCPTCYMLTYPEHGWKVTRQDWPTDEQIDRLTAVLATVSGLGDDAGRVARCIIDFGWKHPTQET